VITVFLELKNKKRLGASFYFEPEKKGFLPIEVNSFSSL